MWQSLSEVQGTVLRHPPSHRASWRVPPHTPCREAFFCVSQVLRHDNPKLNSKDDNHSTFWDVLRRNICHWRNLPGKICWRNLPGEIRRRNLLANLPAKFVGEICGGICRRNFRQKKLVKTSRIFRRKTTPKNFTCKLHRSQNVPSTHPKNPACFFSRSARGSSSGQGTLCVHALQTPAPSKRHEEGYQSWGFLLSLQSRELCGIVTACIRWPLGLGPSGSRLQKEYSVVARVSKRGGGGALRFE